MKIRASATASPSRPQLSPRWRRRSLGAAIVCLVAVCSGLAFSAGVAYYLSVRPQLLDLTSEVRTGPALRSLLSAPRNFVTALGSSEPVERLVLDIGFKNLTRLREKRDEALDAGVLMASDEDFVPASIRNEGRAIPVKLRLKGDFTEHLEGDKWSFRVQVRRGEQLFGMRRFSLQAPRTRGFQGEPVVFAHLRREGVLAPRYFFADVSVNGEDIGLMAVEEHFSKELLESQQRREGVIVHFDEDVFFRNRLLNGDFGPYGNPLISPVRPFRASSVAESEKLSSDLEIATGLLRSFMEGVLPAHQVFDVERMTRFLAVAEVWHASHMLAWHNLRFYLNPLTLRLEPIGFDASLHLLIKGPDLDARRDLFTSIVLDDPQMRSAFVQNLRRIAGEMSDGTLVEWVRGVEEPILRVLHREYPYRSPLDLGRLVQRARYLATITEENFAHFDSPLGRPDMVYPDPLRVYLYSDENPPRIEFVNALPIPVTVTSLRLSDLATGVVGEIQPDSPRAMPLTIPGTGHLKAPEPVHIRFEPPTSGAPFAIEGTARVAGQSRQYPFRADPYFAPRRHHPIPTASLDQVLDEHPFLRWDAGARRLRAEPGSWDVEGSLVLPEGLALSLVSGTELRFSPGEGLVASGPLHFSGTAARPVVLRERDGEEGWSGIVVLRSSEPYKWEHVTVANTTGVDRKGWQLTGGVTLRLSDVELFEVTFQGSRAEDALNLIRSRFNLENTSFFDTASDALDADFSDGSIVGGSYARVAGDGIDVSGAEVSVSGVHFEDIQDKALSVGEASRLVAKNLSIERVGTAAVSKDRSTLVLEDSEISDASRAGVMAYVKKPEYGFPEVRLRGVAMKGVERMVVAQHGSRVVMDGRDIETEDIDVERLYEVEPALP